MDLVLAAPRERAVDERVLPSQPDSFGKAVLHRLKRRPRSCPVQRHGPDRAVRGESGPRARDVCGEEGDVLVEELPAAVVDRHDGGSETVKADGAVTVEHAAPERSRALQRRVCPAAVEALAPHDSPALEVFAQRRRAKMDPDRAVASSVAAFEQPSLRASEEAGELLQVATVGEPELEPDRLILAAAAVGHQEAEPVRAGRRDPPERVRVGWVLAYGADEVGTPAPPQDRPDGADMYALRSRGRSGRRRGFDHRHDLVLGLRGHPVQAPAVAAYEAEGLALDVPEGCLRRRCDRGRLAATALTASARVRCRRYIGCGGFHGSSAPSAGCAWGWDRNPEVAVQPFANLAEQITPQVQSPGQLVKRRPQVVHAPADSAAVAEEPLLGRFADPARRPWIVVDRAPAFPVAVVLADVAECGEVLARRPALDRIVDRGAPWRRRRRAASDPFRRARVIGGRVRQPADEVADVVGARGEVGVDE